MEPVLHLLSVYGLVVVHLFLILRCRSLILLL
jgi:hypothetical protein